MDQTDLCYLSATDLAAKVRAREVSPVEVVDAFLARIEQVNPRVNAYVTMTADAARANARAVEQFLARGEEVGPLGGVPVSIKDVLAIKGVRMTRGSLLFADAVSSEDAPVVERLRAAGAIVLGKTNTPEFGWTGITDNRLFGPTRNPWDLDRTPGGSSGGAGAAVAAGLGPLAIGTDGGGSVRIPAGFCGIVGLKATFGLVPSYPPSWAESLSHTGPMARTVRDVALMLDVIAGADERDRNSFPIGAGSYVESLIRGVRGLRVAWSPDLGHAAVDREVRQASERAARRFVELGCEVEEATPDFSAMGRIWETLFYAPISAAIEALPDWRDKIDPGLAAWVERARTWSAYDLARAIQTRVAVHDAARRFFERYDLLLTPSLAAPPFPIGTMGPSEIDGKKIEGLQWSPFTAAFNLTGQPAISIPCGWTTKGLPLGLQIVGRRHEDATVLCAAAAYEEIAPWVDRRPSLD